MDFLLLHSTTILSGFIRLKEGKATFDDFDQSGPSYHWQRWQWNLTTHISPSRKINFVELRAPYFLNSVETRVALCRIRPATKSCMGIIYWAGVAPIGSQIFANELSNKEYTTPTQDETKQIPINFYLLKMMLEAESSLRSRTESVMS